MKYWLESEMTRDKERERETCETRGLLPIGLQTHLMLTAFRPVRHFVSLPLDLLNTWFAAVIPANT